MPEDKDLRVRSHVLSLTFFGGIRVGERTPVDTHPKLADGLAIKLNVLWLHDAYHLRL
jgi:hypothetical protein